MLGLFSDFTPWFLSCFWPVFGIILATAVILLVSGVVKKSGVLGIVGAALIPLCALLFGVYQYSQSERSPVGKPELEITNQIEEARGDVLYLAWVVVLNRGTGTARNCVIEIEHRPTGEGEYEFLGYAPFQDESFAPHTQSKFWLLLGRSYDEGAHWETWIILRDIRDYAAQESNVVHYPVSAGEYRLKLIMIAENAESSPREFKLSVSEDGVEPPKLELLSQESIPAED